LLIAAHHSSLRVAHHRAHAPAHAVALTDGPAPSASVLRTSCRRPVGPAQQLLLVSTKQTSHLAALGGPSVTTSPRDRDNGARRDSRVAGVTTFSGSSGLSIRRRGRPSHALYHPSFHENLTTHEAVRAVVPRRG
jgi:hypothetical protein